jgi:hypothetical protein
MDASRDTAPPEEELSIRCGSKTCTGTTVQETPINPCCVPEDNGCGLNADDLRRANSSTPFTGCVPKDVEAAVEKSVYCGEFWDQVEMVKRDNGGLDIASGTVTLTFDGCCLPSGECGALINTPRNQDPEAINTHLGCVSFGRLQTALASDDAATMEQPEHLPFCNPATGDPVDGDMTVPGVAKFACGCGVGNVYNPLDTTRTFPCLSNLPTTVCGREEPKDTELAMVPEFLCGCTGATPNGLPCMANVDKAVCGTKAITATSAELARVPSFICGAGTTPSALPTLPNVESTVCGTKTPTAGDLAQVPAFICGEMGNPDTRFPKLRNLPATTCGGLVVGNGSPYLATVQEFVCGCTAKSTLPCLRNLEASTCGSKQVAAGAEELTMLPEYLCGCGPDTVDPQTSLTCLSHVETTVCGAVPVTASAALAQVPEVLCGCGDGVIAPRCLPNVPANLCGTADAAAALANLPDFLCGCGDGVLAGPRPCLNNIPKESCGALDVPPSAATYLPGSLCGCGTTVTYDAGTFPSPCLSKSAPNECGGGAVPTSDPNNTPSNTADDCFTGIASFVRGCGVGVAENTTARTCLPNGANTMFGCNQPTVGPTIAGQLKHACGCGVGVVAANCLPNTATTACGSADPTPTQLAGLPTYLCGCGAAIPARPSATTSLPCLSYQATTVCGTGSVQVNAGYLPSFPASLCGCGASTTYNPASPGTTPVPCLSGQATTVCGAGAISVTDRADPAPDCFTGVPEYVRGCGAGTPAASYPPTCISNGNTALYGCTDVTANVAGQPSFVCGCGENVPVPNAPCLSNVSSAYCGTTAFAGAAVPGLPNSICGCDPDTSDGTVVKWNPLTGPACFSTLANTVCGTSAVCGPVGGVGGAGGCPTGTCTDSNSDTIGDSCQ